MEGGGRPILEGFRKPLDKSHQSKDFCPSPSCPAWTPITVQLSLAYNAGELVCPLANQNQLMVVGVLHGSYLGKTAFKMDFTAVCMCGDTWGCLLTSLHGEGAAEECNMCKFDYAHCSEGWLFWEGRVVMKLRCSSAFPPCRVQPNTFQILSVSIVRVHSKSPGWLYIRIVPQPFTFLKKNLLCYLWLSPHSFYTSGKTCCAVPSKGFGFGVCIDHLVFKGIILTLPKLRWIPCSSLFSLGKFRSQSKFIISRNISQICCNITYLFASFFSSAVFWRLLEL